ncbi:50S ribosomal protein L35 [Plasmodiophora brassicae]|nr:hypothetical protein PBRA_004069 [Plasmodiophora brassicae]
MFTSLARFVGGGAVRAALGHSVAWFATRLKTHKGMAKRVRVTGKGKLKCSAIGRRHRAQSNNGVKVQRLRKTDYITGADAKTIKGMIRAR